MDTELKELIKKFKSGNYFKEETHLSYEKLNLLGNEIINVSSFMGIENFNLMGYFNHTSDQRRTDFENLQWLSSLGTKPAKADPDVDGRNAPDGIIRGAPGGDGGNKEERDTDGGDGTILKLDGNIGGLKGSAGGTDGDAGYFHSGYITGRACEGNENNICTTTLLDIYPLVSDGTKLINSLVFSSAGAGTDISDEAGNSQTLGNTFNFEYSGVPKFSFQAFSIFWNKETETCDVAPFRLV